MGLVLLVRLATILFYSRTLWHAFKALKVPKRRRKIPRSEALVQTQPSNHPLNQRQRERRTRIKEITQLCLVWVIWTHSKRFLDWIAWAIPFYDELNLVFLLWLILSGPSAADTLFRHAIHRLVTPYERSFDSILGTTHDFLQISIYLITSGPKHLSLSWQKWKARQFNKSLLSTPAVAPPTRTHVPPSYHSQPNPKLKFDNSSFPPASARDHSSNAVLTRPGSSTYLAVPERKPTLSRKLSDGYKRSVSSSRPKALLRDKALYNTRSISTNRAVYPFRCSSYGVTLLPSDLNYSKALSKSSGQYQVSEAGRSSKENMYLTSPGNQIQEEETNSIIIHDDSRSIHEPDLRSIIYDPQHTLRTSSSRKKRGRNINDDDNALAYRKAKKALHDASVKRVPKLNISSAGKAPLQAPDYTTIAPLIIPGQSEPAKTSPSKPCASRTKDSSGPSANAASSALLLHTQVEQEGPIPQRLHHPDDPLPLPNTQPHLQQQDSMPVDQHEEIREKALNSVRSLTSTTDLPSPSRWLSNRIPTASLFNPSSSLTTNDSKIKTCRAMISSSSRSSSFDLNKSDFLLGKKNSSLALTDLDTCLTSTPEIINKKTKREVDSQSGSQNQVMIDPTNSLPRIRCSQTQTQVKTAFDLIQCRDGHSNQVLSVPLNEAPSGSLNQVPSGSLNQFPSRPMNQVKVNSVSLNQSLSDYMDDFPSGSFNQVPSDYLNESIPASLNRVLLAPLNQAPSSSFINQTLPDRSNQVLPDRSNQVLPDRSNQVLPDRSNQVLPDRSNQVHVASSNQVPCSSLNDVFPAPLNDDHTAYSNQLHPASWNQVPSSSSNVVLPAPLNQTPSDSLNQVPSSSWNEILAAPSNEVESGSSNEVLPAPQSHPESYAIPSVSSKVPPASCPIQHHDSPQVPTTTTTTTSNFSQIPTACQVSKTFSQVPLTSFGIPSPSIVSQITPSSFSTLALSSDQINPSSSNSSQRADTPPSSLLPPFLSSTFDC